MSSDFKHAPDRLTVIERVYHTSDEDGVAEDVTRFIRHLKSKEQPYARRLVIKPEWTLLDTGWITAASMLSLTNMELMHLKPYASDALTEQYQRAAVELSYSKNSAEAFIIFPQESFRGVPSTLKGLYVRSMIHPVKAVIRVYPE